MGVGGGARGQMFKSTPAAAGQDLMMDLQSDHGQWSLQATRANWLPPSALRCCPQVVKHTGLLSSSSTALLQSKLALRAPYVAPLNILQVSLHPRDCLLPRGLQPSCLRFFAFCQLL